MTSIRHRSAARGRFTAEAAGAAMLVALAQWLFFGREEVGATLGGFVLLWTAILALAVPRMRRGVSAVLLALAAAFAMTLVDTPGPLGWLLAWTAIASAALLPRHRFDDAVSWCARLTAHGLIGLAAPLRDLLKVLRRRRGIDPVAVLGLVAVPVVGTILFGGLFASANPVISGALDALTGPSLETIVTHLLFWGAMLVILWPSFRPCSVRLDAGLVRALPASIGFAVPTLAVSLVTFNALFAVQNALDIAFLWSGAPLPAGVTISDYAHRGAYPLIVTALLAGGFVVIAARPGSAAAASPLVRRLVLVWIAQNLLLVASSALRTIYYVAAFGLTEWRIAALAWMALVAVGLVLACRRMLGGRSAAWLVNANALAAAAVLSAATIVDLGAIAARWNVDHARAASDLDLCYLASQGDAALLPLIDLERRAGGPILRDRARALRIAGIANLARRQGDWRS